MKPSLKNYKFDLIDQGVNGNNSKVYGPSFQVKSDLTQLISSQKVPEVRFKDSENFKNETLTQPNNFFSYADKCRELF